MLRVFKKQILFEGLKTQSKVPENKRLNQLQLCRIMNKINLKELFTRAILLLGQPKKATTQIVFLRNSFFIKNIKEGNGFYNPPQLRTTLAWQKWRLSAF